MTRQIIAHFRPARVHWSTLAFLLGFTILLIGISYYSLIPGLEAAKDATTPEKRSLVAWYRLLLAVILFILLAGLLMTFRIGRFFFPRPTPPRTQTTYVDAWAESGKRIQIPPDETVSDK